LITTNDWVERALEAGKRGWSIESTDIVPEVLASFDGKRILSALSSCATEGVLSVVGDRATAQRAVAEAWWPSKTEGRTKASRP